MSIADKLVTIAENQQKVYEAGKKTEWDNFWDVFQKTNSGNDRTDYSYAFYGGVGCGWNATNFKPKYDLRPTVANYMFHQFSSGYIDSLTDMLEQAGVVLDTSQCTSHDRMFANSPILDAPHIDLTKSTAVGYLFYSCLYLKKAEITLPEKTVSNYSGMFTHCQSLEDLTINGTADKSLSLAQSPKLTTTSLQSVIGSLKDLTGATSQTLTLHADAAAKLTDEQKAIISAKNWNLVY